VLHQVRSLLQVFQDDVELVAADFRTVEVIIDDELVLGSDLVVPDRCSKYSRMTFSWWPQTPGQLKSS